MLLELLLVLTVELQTSYDGDGRGDDFDDRDPNVSEMHAVRLLAVRSRSKRGGSCDPDDERDRNKLQSAVPYALRYLLGIYRHD
jgi:hypothetical protein